MAQYGKRHWPFGYQLLFYHHELTENFLHKRFKHLRIAGTEWFHLKDDLLGFLREPSKLVEEIRSFDKHPDELTTYQIVQLFGVPA